MLKQKLFVMTALVVALILGFQANSFALGGGKKRQAKFTVRIENISAADGLTAQDGSRYPFALSPGMFVLTENKTDFFKVGKKAGEGLEAQAEDGNPESLAKRLLTKIGSANMGVFNMPTGADKPAPILPSGSYEFTFTAEEGMKLNLVAMFGQSNDLFYAPARAIGLFEDGKALSGDITDKFMLYDAGTEVNQAPGIGDVQAPRQKSPNTGAAENGVVRLIEDVKDGFDYPKTKDVLRITISHS